MSVLLVTDDADDDIQNYSLTNPKEDFYKQLKGLEYDFSSSLVRSFSIVESTSSIIVQSNQHYRQHRRRRRCRPQQCVVQHLLTYMLTLLILTNHLHWPVIILSLSSIKLMSTQASIITTTTIGTPTNPITTSKRPILTPSTTRFLFKEDEQQCLPINASQIDRICSKTCRARKTPFEKFEHVNSLIIDLHFLPFCANLFNQTIIKENFFNEVTETECRQHLQQLTDSDEEARIATESFAIYMESIDSASKENRYSIIIADCQKAYRTWACSVNIPYYHQNHLIPPCQTICDEVERVCPTFRPSDREPLFAGQPLFFCNGGIIGSNDYGHRPHCFDTCHLSHGSLQRPSSVSTSLLNESSYPISSFEKFVENLVTTPPCFEIIPLTSSSSEQTTSSLIFVDESIAHNTSSTSLSASAITITSSSWSSIILTFIFVFQMKF
jgi:hypothetical protein